MLMEKSNPAVPLRGVFTGLALFFCLAVASAQPITTHVPPINQPHLIRQHWGDALFFDNSSGQYIQWQWYKNGNAIPGATNSYYSEAPALNGQYYVIATNRAGEQIRACPVYVISNGISPDGIKVFPSAAGGGASVSIVCDHTAEALRGARIQILDLSGKVWQEITNVQPSMQVTMPAAEGLYTIYLLLSNGQKATANMLIKGE